MFVTEALLLQTYLEHVLDIGFRTFVVQTFFKGWFKQHW